VHRRNKQKKQSGKIKNGAKISPDNNNKDETFSKKKFKKDAENKANNRTVINTMTAKINHKRTDRVCGLG
jgi:hypothetical protein